MTEYKLPPNSAPHLNKCLLPWQPYTILWPQTFPCYPIHLLLITKMGCVRASSHGLPLLSGECGHLWLLHLPVCWSSIWDPHWDLHLLGRSVGLPPFKESQPPSLLRAKLFYFTAFQRQRLLSRWRSPLQWVFALAPLWLTWFSIHHLLHRSHSITCFTASLGLFPHPPATDCLNTWRQKLCNSPNKLETRKSDLHITERYCQLYPMGL